MQMIRLLFSLKTPLQIFVSKRSVSWPSHLKRVSTVTDREERASEITGLLAFLHLLSRLTVIFLGIHFSLLLSLSSILNWHTTK